MKNIFLILVFAPLLVSIKFPFIDWEWEWNWNIDWDFNGFIDQIKTGVPQFIKDLRDDMSNFLKQAESIRNKIIDDFKDNAMSAYENIKDATDKQFKTVIEEATKAAKYMSYEICNATNMTSYEECRTHKKEVFKQLAQIVHDEFQCSKIITIITDQIIEGDIGQSLKYLLFLINFMTGNPDAVMRGKAQAIYDFMNCLREKLEENWPELETKLNDQSLIIEYKEDITNILLKTMENLVDIIRFEELDGYISKADVKTGLIQNEYTKLIHQNIFEMLKKLNDFNIGSKFYNMSTHLAVNVTLRPNDKELDINQEMITDFKEKGIIVTLKTDFLFKEYTDAYFIQSVVFDSPLVSVRGSSEVHGGTSNNFVGITLYDKNGNEIFVKDINIDSLRPIIYYKKKLYNAMTTCLFYNEIEDKIEDTGVETQIVTIDGEEYLKCIPKHLTSFTVGSYKSADTLAKNTEKKKGFFSWIIVLIIIAVIIAIFTAIVLYFFLSKRKNVDNSQLNQAFPNKDGLVN